MVGNNESLSGNALYPDHMIATGQTCAQTAGRATKKAAMGQCTAHLFRKTRTDATATYSPAWALRDGGGYVLIRKGPASRCWMVIAMTFSEQGRGGCCQLVLARIQVVLDASVALGDAQQLVEETTNGKLHTTRLSSTLRRSLRSRARIKYPRSQYRSARASAEELKQKRLALRGVHHS